MSDGRINSMISNFSKTVTLKDGRPILLRYPLPDDAQRLIEYINPIVREPARILLDVEQTLEEEQEYLAKYFKKAEAGDVIKILAMAENAIVGIADMRRQPFKQRHVGLFGISVGITHRGVGLGNILADEVLAQAKTELKLRMAILTVFAKNIAAISLYKKFGFQEYGRLPDGLFQNNAYEDEIFMYKNL